MISDLTKDKKLLEKYTKSHYKGRFGILYSTKSTKGLPTNFNFNNKATNIIKKNMKKMLL